MPSLRPMLRHLSLAAGCLALALMSTGCARRAPSLLLITVPGLRADRATTQQAPTISRLMQSASRTYTALYTPSPLTAPALAALLTGTADELPDDGSSAEFRIAPGIKSLAQQLQDRHYWTAAVNGEGEVSSLTGLGRGFDVWAAPSLPFDQPILADEVARARPRAGGVIPAAEITSQVSALLRERAAQTAPFFIWVNFADIEQSAASEDPEKEYDVALRAVDGAIGVFEDTLASFGLAKTTVTAVISPHGLALGADGEIGHGLFLSDAVMHVPGAISGAGVKAEAASAPRTLQDVHDDLARALGLETPAAVGPRPVKMASELAARLYGLPVQRAEILATGERRGPTPPPAQIARALALMADTHLALRSADLRTAIPKLREAAAVAPAATAPWLALAQTAQVRALGTPDERTAQATQAVDRLRALAQRRDQKYDYGRALGQTGRRDEALVVARALAREALSPGLTVMVAGLLADLGAYDDATALLDRLVAADPDAPELHEWLGDLANRAGNAYRAKTEYEKTYATPRARTATLLAKIGDAFQALGDPQQALQRYAAAVQADPAYRYPHARAADALLGLGKPGQAADALVKAVPDSGDPVADAQRRAAALQERGLLVAAARTLETALLAHPADPVLTLNLAALRLAANEPAKARDLVGQVLAKSATDSRALVLLAHLEAAEGHADAALQALTRAESGASAELSAQVRLDPAFRAGGETTPLARKAATFGARKSGAS